MKTKSLLAAIILLLSSTAMWAHDAKIGDVYYNLNADNHTATVTYRGSTWTSYSNEYTGSIAIPATVSKDGVTYNVKTIGKWAFFKCSITSVSIPEGVTSIENSAFKECTSLTSAVIPNSVTSLGSGIFDECSKLKTVTIGSGVTSIESSFYGCTKLTTVNINSNAIASNTYSSNSSIKEIFGTQVTKYVFGNTIQQIGSYAFYGCSSLKAVTLPQSITSIGYGAFYGCSGLTSVIIPNRVTSIAGETFRNCTGITSITIPNSVANIGSSAFSGCTNLASVYIESASPATLSSGAFPSASSIYVPNCAYNTFHSANVWKDMSLVPVVVNLSVANNTGGTVIETCGSMKIEAIPYSDYRFKRWLDGNTDNPRTYSLSQANLNFIAEFELDNFNITLTCDASQGSVSGDQGDFLNNTSHTIEAVALYGYHFTQWSDSVTTNPRTFTLTKDTTFTALFAANKYQLELLVDSTMGSIEAEQGEFDYLSDHTIQANAMYGYHFTQWSDGVATNPRTITLIKDTAITAIFAKNTYNITKNADNTQGQISGASQAEYLDNVSIEAIPNYGYHFAQWSDGVKDNPRSIVLTRDTAFTADFEKNAYSIETASNNTAWGVTTGDTTALYLASVEIQATPNNGCTFVQWSDGVTDNPRSIVLTQDTVFTAEFAQIQYTVTLASADTEMGNVTGGGIYSSGTEITISANPNVGYQFVRWSDENTSATRKIIVEKDTNLIAYFEAMKYMIVATANDDALGVVYGAGDYLYNQQASLMAVANAGGEFVTWSNGFVTNPYVFIVTEDLTIQAIFRKKGEGIDETNANAAPYKVIENGQIIILRGDKKYTIQGAEVK